MGSAVLITARPSIPSRPRYSITQLWLLLYSSLLCSSVFNNLRKQHLRRLYRASHIKSSMQHIIQRCNKHLLISTLQICPFTASEDSVPLVFERGASHTPDAFRLWRCFWTVCNLLFKGGWQLQTAGIHRRARFLHHNPLFRSVQITAKMLLSKATVWRALTGPPD